MRGAPCHVAHSATLHRMSATTQAGMLQLLHLELGAALQQATAAEGEAAVPQLIAACCTFAGVAAAVLSDDAAEESMIAAWQSGVSGATGVRPVPVLCQVSFLASQASQPQLSYCGSGKRIAIPHERPTKF